MVRLSAPILTMHRTLSFTGSIEVDIVAEDLPSDDPRQSAQLCKNYLSLHCASIISNYKCAYLIASFSFKSSVMFKHCLHSLPKLICFNLIDA